ncbi:MAG: ABC transporter permease [Candidatus Poribacteria bacterium]|nr:ABC transporter permease [Candidatus Poribacteria bacterium]MDE0505717.1 ABC transporter permease [Candidatus Poribacteria bacterium]
MKLIESIMTAFSTLRASKLRTFLTMLGIIIGIAGIIGMMSFGAGAKALLLWEVEKVGGPSVFGVYRNDWIRKGNKWIRNPSTHYLTMDDVRAIQTECPSVDVATPEMWGHATLIASGKNKNSRMQATTYEYQIARKWYNGYGRFLSDDDLNLWSKVCVIGEQIWKDLFAGLDPVGRELKINNQRFTVIGIMESRGKGLDPENSEDNQVFLPITTAQTHFWGNDRVGHIMIRAKNYELVDRAVREVKTVLDRHHGNLGFFETWIMKEELKTANRIISIIEVILVAIASVSLVVGGIGILNIMLVSVTERIPEIGLRKAVGAKSRDIRLQFLTEAVTLCCIGGLIGIGAGALMGRGFAWAVSKLMQDLIEWPSVITVESILIALLSGVSVGVFFGYYPASRAANLSPIDALRHT